MGEQQSKSSAQPEVHGIMQEGSGDVAAGMAVDAPPPANVGEAAELPGEGEIVGKLIQHLSTIPGNRMPLSELRKNLPPAIRKLAEDTQKISAWLQKFRGIIQIVGEPGNEQVVLSLAGGGAIAPPAPPAVESTEGPAKVVDAPAIVDDAIEEQGALALDDDDSNNACTVQLRGLPFRATVSDIKTFLGYHAVGLSTKDPAIRLLLNRDGRPSGFARVSFVSAQAARDAREQLHKQPMGDRYVEVLACSERAGKMRNRRAAVGETGEGVNEVEAENWPIGGANEAVERERVLQECRDHMRMPGRQQILLSMLGIALSRQARAYLRRVNLGLKHFLARFPNEFRVEGPKGCEKVIWAAGGGMDPYHMAMMGDPMAMMQVGDPIAAAAMAEAQAMAMAAWQQSMSEQQEPETNKLLASPTPQRTAGKHCEQTPSHWGTPGSAEGDEKLVVENSRTANTNTAPGGGGGNPPGMDPAMAFANSFNPQFGWGPWAPWPGCMDMEFSADGMGGKGGKGLPKKPAKAETSSSRSHAHLHPQSHPFAHQPPGTGATTTPASAPTDGAEGDNQNCAALRLRGLPFTMSVQDVLAFFSQHDVADCIAEFSQAAQLLPKANGRPSGQARVQMRSREYAEIARTALDRQWIGGRYIEVFVYGDEPENEANNDWSAGDQAGGDSAAWQRQQPAMPGFPPPMGGPMAFPMGPPPWAMGPPPAVPKWNEGTGPDGANGAGTYDNLFSFLMYPENSEAPGGGSQPPISEPPRNAVQV